MALTADEIMMEMAWERRMMGLGQAEFDKRESSVNDFTNTKTGQTILSELLKRYTNAITILQKRLIGAGKHRENVAPLLYMDPDVYALLALKVVLDTYNSSNEYHGSKGSPVQVISKRVSRSIETEVNFRHWIATSKKTTKEWQRENGIKGTVLSHAERLIKENGVSRQVLSKWRKTFSELAEYEWDDETLVHAGEELLVTLCQEFPQYFEIYMSSENGKTYRRFRKSDEFEDEVRRTADYHKMGCVLLMPMLVEPADWVAT